MLLRNLLGLDPEKALAINQPNHVVFSVDPGASRIESLRVPQDGTFDAG